MSDWRLGVTPDQMREVDQRAEQEYGLTPFLLMENAGLAAARVARTMLGPVAGRAIRILAGPGNNGGDGLVAARRLFGWGAAVTVHTAYDRDAARGLSRVEMDILDRIEVPTETWAGQDLGDADLVIDALLGFGARDAPRDALEAMVLAANAGGRPVLALDVPTGLDPELGGAAGAAVVAAATVTLGLPKTGLLAPAAKPLVGRLWLADIGIPRGLLEAIGVDVAGLFADADIVDLG
ncbi:MAG TPA: NAD(P)H-hydrate epimerase [Candidatus Dormibacteraeota bacterium]|jgi:NAD(P)H-hydrate epimerase|nr:NAD(P)H-hydrate epimerase [Candidatus Dormibacteraeota bacterium]